MEEIAEESPRVEEIAEEEEEEEEEEQQLRRALRASGRSSETCGVDRPSGGG